MDWTCWTSTQHFTSFFFYHTVNVNNIHDMTVTLGNFFFEWNGDILRLPDNIEHIFYNTHTQIFQQPFPRAVHAPTNDSKETSGDQYSSISYRLPLSIMAMRTNLFAFRLLSWRLHPATVLASQLVDCNQITEYKVVWTSLDKVDVLQYCDQIQP